MSNCVSLQITLLVGEGMKFDQLIFRRIVKIDCHQMLDFKAKMQCTYRKSISAGDGAGGAYSAPQTP